ncbi:TMCO1/EMC3 family protein [Candidatus Bathyarchaeota archaeon]|nr:TMCO1/EMC3 family protein [Candidatus Bathyarchaeota archaeon]
MPLNFIANILQGSWDFLKVMPNSTLFILFLTTAIGFATSLINKRMTNMNEYKRLQIEQAKINKEIMAAAKSGNQRRMDRIEKRRAELMSAQSKMSMNTMKVSLVVSIPILFGWKPILDFFGESVVAYFPFPMPLIPAEMSIVSWYFLCSFGTNVIIRRLLGLSFEIDPEEVAVKEDE